MAKRVGNNGNHGAKGRSGRKFAAATILRQRIIENHIAEAEASFAYLVAVRNNEAEPGSVRLAAAEAILDRVLGKPVQGTPRDLPEAAQRLIEQYYTVIGEKKEGK